MKCWMKVETDLNFTQYVTQWFARITLVFEQISKGILENDKLLKGFTNTIILNNFESTPL